MTDKKTPKPAELTEAELDTVAGGGKVTGKTTGSLKERLSDGTSFRRGTTDDHLG